MKLRQCLLVLIIAVNALFGGASSAGPLIVGNAAGTSEFNILMAQKNLSQVLAQCLSLDKCAGKLPETAKQSLLKSWQKIEAAAIMFIADHSLGQPYQFDETANVLKITQESLYGTERQALDYVEAFIFLSKIAYGPRADDDSAQSFFGELAQLAQDLYSFQDFNITPQVTLRTVYFQNDELSLLLSRKNQVIDQYSATLKNRIDCQAATGQAGEAFIQIQSVGYNYHVDTPPFVTYVLGVGAVLSCHDSEQVRKYKVFLSLDVQMDITPNAEALVKRKPYLSILKVEAL